MKKKIISLLLVLTFCVPLQAFAATNRETVMIPLGSKKTIETGSSREIEDVSFVEGETIARKGKTIKKELFEIDKKTYTFRILTAPYEKVIENSAIVKQIIDVWKSDEKYKTDSKREFVFSAPTIKGYKTPVFSTEVLEEEVSKKKSRSTEACDSDYGYKQDLKQKQVTFSSAKISKKNLKAKKKTVLIKYTVTVDETGTKRITETKKGEEVLTKTTNTTKTRIRYIITAKYVKK